MQNRKGSLRAAAVFTCLVVGTAVQLSAAEATDARQFGVRLINQANVPADVMSRAQADASRIYAALGVEIVWIVNANDPLPTAPKVTLVVVPKSMSVSTRFALGTAIANRTSAGRRAYAFLDKVTWFAGGTGQSLSAVLGHVIAHELGHLLIGNNSHALTGIMRSKWTQSEITLLAAGNLTFAHDHATTIRARVRSLLPNP